MTGWDPLWLVLAGFGGGLSGSIAGLASLVSYPSLLAVGLPAISANVTNTVALVFSSVGSVWGSAPELAGQRPLGRRLASVALLGGITGGALILLTPRSTVERIVPFLIGAGSLAVLLPRRRRPLSVGTTSLPVGPGADPSGWPLVAGVFAVAVYGGYFGAAAGVILLALLMYLTGEPLPRSNAMKNLVLGLANGVAAVAFALFGPVRWTAALPLAFGFMVGGRLGPIVVRRFPPGPLRLAIAMSGLGLAVKLGLDAYR